MSLMLNEWSWFSRFGSLCTVAGLMLIMRPIFRKGRFHENSAGQLSEVITIPGEGTKRYFDPEEVKDNESSIKGVVFTILGTIMWGFGDLLSCLIV